jgi:S1-C subfamily serine protease
MGIDGPPRRTKSRRGIRTVRFRFALCICFLLITPILPVSAQDEAWLGATVTSGVGIKWEFESGKRTRERAEAKVVRVDGGGPAAAAGIKVGDVILSVDGQPISSGKELVDAVQSKQPGSTGRVRVRREDGDTELNVVLGKRPKGR